MDSLKRANVEAKPSSEHRVGPDLPRRGTGPVRAEADRSQRAGPVAPSLVPICAVWPGATSDLRPLCPHRVETSRHQADICTTRIGRVRLLDVKSARMLHEFDTNSCTHLDQKPGSCLLYTQVRLVKQWKAKLAQLQKSLHDAAYSYQLTWPPHPKDTAVARL